VDLEETGRFPTSNWFIKKFARLNDTIDSVKLGSVWTIKIHQVEGNESKRNLIGLF